MKKTRIEKLSAKFPFATYDLLHRLYVLEEKSLPDIRKEYGIDFKAMKDLLTYYNIPLRTISQSRLTTTAKTKIKQTLEKTYGVSNPSQLDWVKEKKKKTFLSHYGVDNIWKSETYYKWLDDYMLIHYGAKRITTNPWGWQGAGKKRKDERIRKLWDGRDEWWSSLDDEERSKIMAKLCSKNTFGSKIESRVREALDRIHISHKRWVSIGNRNFDFKIDGCKILIEVNGDFWHANPSKYAASDIIPFPDGHRKAKDIWEKDEKKRLTAEQNGYRVLVLWEEALKSMSDKEVETWLLKQIVI